MKRLLILILLFLSVSHAFPLKGQENFFYSKTLVDSILQDTITIVDDHVLIEKMKDVVKSMENDKGIPYKMFPFTQYDSVVAYRFNKNVPLYLEYNDDEDEKNNPTVSVFNKNKIKSNLLIGGKKLSKTQKDKLLYFINNPRNFSFGYIAGCNFSIGLIVFYYKGRIKSYIHIDSMYMVWCNPISLRIQDGLLSSEGYKIIPFLEEIGYKLLK